MRPYTAHASGELKHTSLGFKTQLNRLIVRNADHFLEDKG